MLRIAITIYFLQYALTISSQDALAEAITLLDDTQYEQAAYNLNLFLKENSQNKTAQICYGRAVGLGGDPQSALTIFHKLSEDYPNDFEILLNLAECHLWNRNAIEATKIYNSLLNKDASNFTALLGKANASAMIGNYAAALDEIDKALEVQPSNTMAAVSRQSIQIALAYQAYKKGDYTVSTTILDEVLSENPNSSQALQISQSIREDSKSSLGLKYQVLSDNGGHTTQSRIIDFGFRLGGKHKLALAFGDNSYANNYDEREAQSQFMYIGDKLTLGPKMALTLGLNLSQNRSSLTKYRLTTYLAELERFWNEAWYSKVSYKQENHNYNVDLLGAQILMQHFGINNNINFSKWLGWYSELVYTTQSDRNERRLLFSSVYLNIGSKPKIKVGYNLHTLAFNQQSDRYFSPSSFLANEFFVLITNQETAGRLFYFLQMTMGQQSIEFAPQQITSRAEAKCHYKLSSKLLIHAEYLFSNAASATALGTYSSTRISFGLKFSLN